MALGEVIAGVDRLRGSRIAIHVFLEQRDGVEPGDGLAYIGPVDSHENVAYATGHSGNGMTYAVIAAEIFAAHVLGQTSPWMAAYSARRPAHLKPHLTKATEYIAQFSRGAVKNTLRFLGRA